MGERFRLERSVRQGCPLAPYLFLFFAEAMAHYLRARSTGIQGVRLPIREDSELLDSEYADDTALYGGQGRLPTSSGYSPTRVFQ